MKTLLLKALIAKKNDLEKQLNAVRKQIRETTDGFMYVTALHRYGSVRWEIHNNPCAVYDLCNEYTGDNGILDIYTNNSDELKEFEENNWSGGKNKLMSIKEMQNMQKTNVSMNKAICNWISLGAQ